MITRTQEEKRNLFSAKLLDGHCLIYCNVVIEVGPGMYLWQNLNYQIQQKTRIHVLVLQTNFILLICLTYRLGKSNYFSKSKIILFF